jgi:hypothetical protein
MFTAIFTYDGRLEGLDEEIKTAVAAKLNQLTYSLYSKVMENVEGRILQKRSGDLASSIRMEVDTSSNPMVGTVFPEPADAKAWALERGGDRDYPIVPTKGSVLAFYWEKEGRFAFLPSVNHPPSRAFRYLGLALDEIEPTISSEFLEAINEVLHR